MKDAFHRYLVDGEQQAVNPANQGSKFAAAYHLSAAAGETSHIELVLSDTSLDAPFAHSADLFELRREQSSQFYNGLLPNANAEDHAGVSAGLSRSLIDFNTPR